MHAASVRLRLPDGSTETLYAGDLIGRTWAAALRFDDPHISEAHAMVSLRGEQLWLLALRRRFLIEGRPTDAAPLVSGLVIGLAPEVSVLVEQVSLPDHLLGLEGPGLPAQALPGTCSLVFDPHPRLAPGVQADAAAAFWTTESRWRLRRRGHPPEDLRPHTILPAPDGQGAFRVISITLGAAGQDATRAEAAGPLHIESTFDTVHIRRADGEEVVLAGQIARVVAELVSVQQPLSWEELARPHWPHIHDRDVLRRRWDGLLGRLRDRLRAGGLPTDLVASTRVGLVELRLREGDTVLDRS